MSQKLQQEARDRGEMYFYTGKPCKYGHDSPRLTSCYNCAQCHEEWRAKRRAATKKRLASGIYPKKRGKGKKKRSPKPKKNKGILIYKEVRITEEEIKEESFNEMAKRVYKRDQSW